LKIIGRIAYAGFMALLFIFVLDYTKGLMESKYFQKYAEVGLQETVSDYFFFYSSIPDYHQEEPILSIDQAGVEIRFYEIAKTSITESGLHVEEFVYVLVYGKSADIPIDAVIHLSGTRDLDISLDRFRALDLYLGVNESGAVYLDKSLLASPDFDSISLRSDSSGDLVEVPYQLSADAFVLREALTDYYLVHENLPVLELENAGVYPYIQHVATEFAYIVWIGFGVYAVFLTTATILLFFRKKRVLGKNEPSALLNKEIEDNRH